MAARKLRPAAALSPGDPLPKLGYGRGGYAWDMGRGQIVLRHVVEGERYTERGRSIEEVEAKRAERQAKVTGILPSGTVREMTAAYFAAFRNKNGTDRAHNTYESLGRIIGHIDEQLGNVEAAKLTASRVEHMLTTLSHAPYNNGRGLGAGTLRGILNRFGGICRWAMGKQMMTLDPTIGVEMPGEAKVNDRERKEAAAASKDEWFKSLDDYNTVRSFLIDDHSTMHLLFLVMLDAGLRPGEAQGVRWDAIDFKAGTLRVVEQMRLEHDGTRRISSTLKTDRHGDRAHRTIPLTAELADALRRERREQFEAGTFGEHVFASVGRNFEEGGRRIAAAAGVTYVPPNGYRKTFASNLLNDGISHERVAKLMGHKDIRMLIAHYGLPVEDAPVDLAALAARRRVV